MNKKITLRKVWRKHRTMKSLSDDELLFLIWELGVLEKKLIQMCPEFHTAQRCISIDLANVKKYASARSLNYDHFKLHKEFGNG